MRILFLSGGARAKALRFLLEKGESVSAVITPTLSEKNRRFIEVLEVAKEYGVPSYQLKREELFGVINSIEYDILVSCGFTYILSDEVIQTAQYAINVHPTLLPKYRGARSGPFIILNGEKKSGVTVHYLTSEMDKGDILAQREFDVSQFDTMKSLYRKTQAIEPTLLYEVIQDIKNGKARGIPQDETKSSTYTQVRTPKDSLIDWNKSLKELYNEIRACDPKDYPAYFFVEGQKVCIQMWRPEKPPGGEDLI